MRRYVILYVICCALVYCVVSIASGRNLATNGMSGGAGVSSPPAITSASFGTPWPYNQTVSTNGKTVNGDGWNTTWDNLGNIFTLSNDGSPWNGSGSGSQILFSSLTNTAGDATTVGTLVNGMGAWNGAAPPGGTWKWQGVISVGGVIYAIINNISNSAIGDIVYQQVVKSTDHGVTFTPSPPYSTPTFPSPGTGPYTFVQYGQNYTCTGPCPDNANTYVYAMVAHGGGTGGGPYISRVPIPSDLQVQSNWQFWTGGDGMNSANWSNNWTGFDGLAVAIPVTGAAGPSSMQYLPRYQKYFSVTYTWDFNVPPSTSYFQVCDHPWGPCNQLGGGTVWNPYAFYGFAVAPSSLVNGGQQMAVTMAGNFHTCCGGTPDYYTLWIVPVTLTP